MTNLALYDSYLTKSSPFIPTKSGSIWFRLLPSVVFYKDLVLLISLKPAFVNRIL